MAVKIKKTKVGTKQSTTKRTVAKGADIKRITPPADLTKRFKRVAELPEEHREVMHGMFADGKSVPEIVAVLQELGHFKDVKTQSLTQYFYRYKWDVLDKQILIQAEMLNKNHKATLLNEISKSIDVVQEVSALITIQKGRVSKLLNREKDMPMLFNSLGGEMKTLAGLIQQYADLSFDLGTLKKAPQVTKISKDGGVTLVESDGRDHVQFNVQNADKIEQAARAFFDALESDENGPVDSTESLH